MIVIFDHKIHKPGNLERAIFKNDPSDDYSSYKGWTLLSNDDLIGVCLYKIFDDKNWNFSLIMVAPCYAKYGHGTQMMMKLIEAADNAGVTMTLKVYNNQQYLINFYFKFGFVILNPEVMIRKSKVF